MHQAAGFREAILFLLLEAGDKLAVIVQVAQSDEIIKFFAGKK